MASIEKTGPDGHSRGLLAEAAVCTGGWLLLAMVLVAASGLAGWGLRPAEIAGITACWGVARLAPEVFRMRGRGLAGTMELAAGLSLWAAWNFWGVAQSLSIGSFARACGLMIVVVGGWRWWSGHNAAVRAEPVGETIRVMGVLSGAFTVMLPLCADRLVGGTDARWYAYMMSDFIEQWREAGPPVFIGQGEFVWNGAVHPFRSAPVYMHVGGLWDWLTGGTLAFAALQHLAAITGAVGCAWGMYAAGVKLAPQRRWEAAALAFLYVVSPAALMPLYIADAYMTYMAFSAFAWLFYGNARVLAEGKGWLCLAGGLSLAWMSHPPTAMQATLLTAFLQTGGLAFRRTDWADWRRASGAAVVFVLLSLYYLVGMSELPKSPETNLVPSLLQIVALVLGWLAAVQLTVMRRGWAWLLPVVPAGFILWAQCQPWLWWLGLTMLMLGFVSGVARWRRWFDPAEYGPLVFLGCILLSAFLMDGMMRTPLGGVSGYPREGYVWQGAWAASYFRPLTPLLQTDGDFQPGWGLWLGGFAAVIAACRRRNTGGQLVLCGIVLMAPFLLRWPRVGDFLLEYLPHPLRAMTGISMALRTMPVFTVLLATGALLALREEQLMPARKWRRWLIGAVALFAVAWGAWQARRFVQRGERATATPEINARSWRTENAPMDRFVYDLLPTPSYFNHGKFDPRLEVRLLDNQGNLMYGPADVAHAMEQAGVRMVNTVVHRIPGHEQWRRMEPDFVVEPGEHILLRFQFDQAQSYNGMLMFISKNGYREYRLPQAGLVRSFGSGPEQSRLISLWNSGTEAERYHLQMLLAPGSDLAEGTRFAEIAISRFEPGRALIEVESLRPLRIRTRFEEWSGQLETPRVFLPGYEVRVDGRRIGPDRISPSPDHLLQIAMPPGEHTVELNYIGTTKLRIAGGISLAMWCGLLVWIAIDGRRKKSNPVGEV